MSLKYLSNMPTYVGGITALELLGFAQYLSRSSSQTVHLYSESKPPPWLFKLDLGVAFKWHGTKTLWPSRLMADKRYEKEHTWRDDLPPLPLSCPEKAYIEMLVDVPQKISFDHADELIQGMTSLSPNKLNTLLKLCRNVKIKRLFLWLAQRQSYPWFKRLKVEEFDLGKGKRMIASGGKLDKKYMITVPEHLYG
jgi:Transcriptional regulator, AbiEi antitoxin, Type IV TA system